MSRPFGLPAQRCAAVADALDLDLDATGICLACLSFVSFPLDDGDDAQAKREARRIAPDLWEEGLADPLLAALEAACDDGVPDAEAAWRDVQSRGPRSATVRAVVLRLARDLVELERAGRAVVDVARTRRPPPAPELN